MTRAAEDLKRAEARVAKATARAKGPLPPDAWQVRELAYYRAVLAYEAATVGLSTYTRNVTARAMDQGGILPPIGAMRAVAMRAWVRRQSDQELLAQPLLGRVAVAQLRQWAAGSEDI